MQVTLLASSFVILIILAMSIGMYSYIFLHFDHLWVPFCSSLIALPGHYHVACFGGGNRLVQVKVPDNSCQLFSGFVTMKHILLSSSKLSSYHELNHGLKSWKYILRACVFGKTFRDPDWPQPKMGRKCRANFSFLLLHSWNLKEIEEFSSISYSQAVSSGPSTFQVVL